MEKPELQVVFGTGQLGTALVHELLRQGKLVRAVNRQGRANLPRGVEVLKADATDPAKVREACHGAAVVYNCTNAPYTEWVQKFPPIMTGIIEGVGAVGAKLVFGDNLYMYGLVSGLIRENLPYKATGRKGRIRAQMAEMLMAAHRSGKVRATIGRASNFYGPGVTDSVVGEGVFGAALNGKPAQILGDPDALHTYTFIDDFAKGLITLGAREEALGEAWHIPTAETLTTRQFVETVFAEIGTPAKLSVAPKLGIEFLSLFNPMMREVKEMLYEFESSFVVDHSKYERVFGSNPTPHRESIQQTLRWFSQRSFPVEQQRKSAVRN